MSWDAAHSLVFTYFGGNSNMLVHQGRISSPAQCPTHLDLAAGELQSALHPANSSP